MPSENDKTLLKEMKDLIKWEDIPCSQIGTLNIVKMARGLEAMYGCTDSTQSLKIPLSFYPYDLLPEMEKPIPKFLWNCKGPEQPKTILKKKMLEVSDFPISTTKLQ